MCGTFLQFSQVFFEGTFWATKVDQKNGYFGRIWLDPLLKGLFCYKHKKKKDSEYLGCIELVMVLFGLCKKQITAPQPLTVTHFDLLLGLAIGLGGGCGGLSSGPSPRTPGGQHLGGQEAVHILELLGHEAGGDGYFSHRGGGQWDLAAHFTTGGHGPGVGQWGDINSITPNINSMIA